MSAVALLDMRPRLLFERNFCTHNIETLMHGTRNTHAARFSQQT